MKITQHWRDWAQDLSPQRLRSLHDHITTHQLINGDLTTADSFLLKLLKQELDRRYK